MNDCDHALMAKAHSYCPSCGASRGQAEAKRGRADTRRLDFLEGHMIEIRFGAWTIRGTETRLVIDQLMASAQARR